MKKVIVWYNPNKDIYYHRLIKCHYAEANYTYEIGSLNSYNHVIVDIIPLSEYLVDYDYNYFVHLKRKTINKCISFLKKL